MPDYWTRVPLEKVGIWQGGGTPSKSHPAYWTNGSIPWVSPKDMKRATIDSAEDKVTDRAVDETGLAVIPPGSVLFVMRSGILARILPTAVTSVPVVINQDLRALTPVADVNPVFLRQQIEYLSPQILRDTVKQGTTVESIELKALLRFEVVLPPLAEQQAISDRLTGVLDMLGETRRELQSVLSLLEAYKRVVLIKALSGEWDKNRPAAETTLEEIADIQGGLALGKRRSGAEVVERPYLRVANVQRGWLDLDDVRDVLVTPAEAERYRLKKGDILLNEGGDRDKLGRGWIWNEQISDCIHQNHVFRARLRDLSFPPEFISLYANEIGRDYFLSAATQTTNLASISKTKLGALRIRLPSADDARAALETYKKTTAWTEGVRQQSLMAIDAVNAAESSAVRKAFSGRLAPNSPHDPLPRLQEDGAKEQRKRRAATRRERIGSTGMTLTEMLESWPDTGLTFEDVRQNVTSDYEGLKDEIFILLTGKEPELEQRYSNDDKVMKFFRRLA